MEGVLREIVLQTPILSTSILVVWTSNHLELEEALLMERLGRRDLGRGVSSFENSRPRT